MCFRTIYGFLHEFLTSGMLLYLYWMINLDYGSFCTFSLGESRELEITDGISLSVCTGFYFEEL